MALQHFEKTDNALTAEFKFDSFKESLDFVVRVGAIAEELNHHPNIEVKYDVVALELTTHDAGNSLSEKDYKLAEEIEKAIS